MSPADNQAQARGAGGKKPWLALAMATSFGVGYLPKAPGTFGSLVGVGIASLLVPAGFQLLNWISRTARPGLGHPPPAGLTFLAISLLVSFLIGFGGVWSASRVAAEANAKDPQQIVIDEVSGQLLTLLFGSVPWLGQFLVRGHADYALTDLTLMHRLLNWKCLLLGFVLFRLFDIWKPWPIQKLEKLPGGWGIMADDWMAGIYAAILLQVALHLDLL